MDEDLYDFDSPLENPGLKDLRTVDNVGFRQTISAPTSPLTVTVEELTRDEVYAYHSKGYSPAQIAKKFNKTLGQIRMMILEEQKDRADVRTKAGVMSLEDSINFYNEIKVQAMERAKYADEKFAPAFIKEAKEAQQSIDKLLGVGTPGMLAVGKQSAEDDESDEGLVQYRERRPILTEAELPVLPETP